MAIFTGKDADLPLLTQFYQIELPTGWQKSDELLLGSELQTWDSRIVSEEAYVSNLWSEEDDEDTRLKWLKVLAEMRIHAKAIMDAVADDGLLSLQTVHYLNAKSLDYLSPRIGYSPCLKNGVKGFEIVSYSDYNENVAQAYADMLRELLQVAGKRITVNRCESCRSVYIERSEIQKYCSWRCNNRERVRRQRQRAVVEATTQRANIPVSVPAEMVFAAARNVAMPQPVPSQRNDAFDDDMSDLSDPFAE
jgi:hypothetical protein